VRWGDTNTKLADEIATLNHKIDELSVKSVMFFPPPPTFYGGVDHLSINCGLGVGNEGIEDVNVVNQGKFRPNNNLYSNTYNPGWRNHPNFSWKQNDTQLAQGNTNNQGNQNFNRQNQGYSNQGYSSKPYVQNVNQGLTSHYQPKSNIELMIEAFMASQNQKFEKLKEHSLVTQTKVDLLTTQNKLLETQVAQQTAHNLCANRVLSLQGRIRTQKMWRRLDICSALGLNTRIHPYRMMIMCSPRVKKSNKKMMSQSPQLRIKPQRNIRSHLIPPIRISR
jgi:hypothetical protein